MKDLIERLRASAQRSNHNTEAADALEQMAAALEAKDEALRVAERNNPDKVLITVFSKALALKPHADFVRKMKADAVREAADEVEVGHPHITRVGASCILRELAASIERGEVK